jgi:putative glutamine amidotransferase
MKKTLYSALWRDFHPFDLYLGDTVAYKTVRSPNDFDGPGMLILHGGEDVAPEIYGKPRSRATGPASSRDDLEVALARAAQAKGISVFGICRGAQLMCALAGGYLIQDVTNHSGSRHTIKTSDGKELLVNSIHHQMQAPWGVDHELLAWSPRRSKYYDDGGEMVEVPCEPEAVWYPGLGMGVQWHPEMMNADAEASLWIRDKLLEKNVL